MKKLSLLIISIFLLVGCNLPGLGGSTKQNDIVIASGNTTERQILAEMVKQMIDYHMDDVNVDILSNLGSSILIHQAMQRNDANISAGMYTGTSLTGEVNKEATTDPDKALFDVVDAYYKNFNATWFPSYGFANTYAFMVTQDFANEHNLEKISDLENIKDQLSAGIDTSWMDREGDGYEAFKEVYGFDFNKVLPMEIGLVYNAVNTGDVNLVLGYSTDGRIAAYDLKVLEDDLHIFPPYDASVVASHEILDAYPELESVLLKLEGSLDPQTMQSLNRISDEQKIEPQKVVEKFLEEHQYFKDVNNTPLIEREHYKDLMSMTKEEE